MENNRENNKKMTSFAALGNLEEVKKAIELGANNFDKAFIKALLNDKWNIMEFILYGGFQLDWVERYKDCCLAFDETQDNRWFVFGNYILQNHFIKK